MKIHEEACQLYIEQEIEEGLKQGKSAYSIGKEISVWVEKLFGRKITPDAVKQQALRKGKKSEQSSELPPTTCNLSENPDNQVAEVKHGGKRGTSGLNNHPHPTAGG
jgi:hypothetical protein